MAIRTRRNSRNTSTRNSSSRRKSTRSSSRGRGDAKFIKLGSITASRKDEGDELVEDLKGCGLQLWCKLFLPEGSKNITLENGTRLMISFKTFENDPDFVMGSVVLPPEDDE